VTTTASYKFLGVIIDSKLCFKEQAASAIGKGTKWTNQVGQLTKNAKEIKGSLARRLYYRAAVARMLYAVDVWCAPVPGSNRGRGNKGVIKKLESIQWKVAIQATGCLCTTPTDLLLTHVDMIPMHQLIQTHSQASALRLATIGVDHPLYKQVQKAAKSYPKMHPSPLHGILQSRRIKPRQIEFINPKPKHPNWASKIQTRIAGNKEVACREDQEENYIFMHLLRRPPLIHTD
ncbi:hypothetical protein BYT27DRAFT_7106097, partial [Phlegmacium glaucopus]